MDERGGTSYDGTELDFWLGDWDATWDGGHGTNHLERDFDGRVIHDAGSYFDFVGDRVDGSFAFVREAPELGDGGRQRMVFRDIEPSRFRWTWERSLDGGATWELRWEIGYRRVSEPR